METPWRVSSEQNGAKAGMPPQYNMNGYKMFKTLASRLAGAQFVFLLPLDVGRGSQGTSSEVQQGS